MNNYRNLIKSISLFLIGAAAICFNSCEQDFVNNNTDIVKFPPEIEAIFSTPYTANNLSCNTPSCHSNENSASGFNLVDWQKAMNGSDNGTMIIPYNGFWSHLIAVVNNDTLFAPVTTVSFPEYHKIDAQKVNTLNNWINAGAKNADGQAAFTNVPRTDKTFITNQASDLVAVLQTDTRRVLRLIPVGGSNQLDAPHYVVLSPDQNFFYISLIQEGYIEKYDVNLDYPFSRTDRLQVGLNPAHIVISPDGATGYVTNFDASGTERNIRKFSTSSPMQVTGIFQDQKMTAPHGMALTNDGSRLFVSSEVGEYIFKINTASFINSDSTVIKEPIDPSVPPNGQGTGNFKPYQIILSQDESLIYVSCRGANQVRVYRTDDLSMVTQIPLGTGAYPLLMKLTSDGNYLFTCNRNNNTVSVINTLTQTVVTTISGVGIQPHGVDFTPDGQYAIISCETQSGFDGHHPTVGSTKLGVSRVIRVSDFSLLSDRIEMASFPAGIAVVR
ncbi:MAG: beta-propeller fold lactonase family protein [Bacteroidetes bacterium]|nr:beta-propeller fold lactonase family protein [Bacteroidota bacterium]